MAVNTYQKGSNAILSTHFKSSEFDCKCPQCTETKIDSDLITLLEKIRENTGPLKITSGYRCSHYQTELRLRGYETAVGVSQHELGRAADVTGEDTEYSGAQLEQLARNAGFKAVGVGRSWVHVDLRNEKERRWTYSY